MASAVPVVPARDAPRSIFSAEPPPPPGRADWHRDLLASLIVALVALPLCLGVALASGAPLIAGLVAGVIGGLVVGPLSGSALMVSGPAAGLTAVVLSAVTTLGHFDRFVVAVCIGGVVQVALGTARAGFVAYYIPNAVIKAMLAAIGVILILKQVPHVVGYDPDPLGDEAFRQANSENTFTAIGHALGAVEPLALALGVASLGILFAWEHPSLAGVRRRLPGPLVVVLLGLATQMLAASNGAGLAASHLVALPTPGTAAAFRAQFVRPDWTALADADTWRIGLMVGLVASVETLLSLEATDKMDAWRRRSPANRELFAQGVGNVLSGLAGGLPVTGVIVRSAANVAAGARTRRSATLHGAWLLLAVLLLPGLLNRIPLAVLAAVLLHTGWKLAHPRVLRSTWRLGWMQFVPFVATFAAILFTDLLVGIGVGSAVAAVFILLEHLTAPCFTEVSAPGALLRRLRLNGHVTFLNKAMLRRELDALAPGDRIEIDGRDAQRIDPDVLEILHEYHLTARLKDVDYRLVGVPEPSAAAAAH
ncbi:MAG: SulP family inorganic anion transporter [Gemmatimonadota bacterium]|jgi:MFS superfamily sulfate permease-like transporter|nr:SulP family inorganic anion transporter [Gemmatimonadota bacterium]